MFAVLKTGDPEAHLKVDRVDCSLLGLMKDWLTGGIAVRDWEAIRSDQARQHREGQGSVTK